MNELSAFPPAETFPKYSSPPHVLSCVICHLGIGAMHVDDPFLNGQIKEVTYVFYSLGVPLETPLAGKEVVSFS